MILATKSGWLISGSIIRETKKFFIFQEKFTTSERKVKKSSATERLFDDAFIASDWIDNINKI